MNDTSPLLDYRKFPLLYVDDEHDNLEAFTDEFDQYFNIHTADSGASGLDVIEEKPIAIILADQRMPTMAGIEFLKRVRQKAPNIIRILITAYSDIEVVIEAINLGQVYRYISKPWEHDELRHTIMRCIDHYHAEREVERLTIERIENVKKMEHASKLAAIGRLAAGVAHEIRNPLVSIQTFFDLLPQKRDDDDFCTNFLSLVKGEVNRIRNLITNLLTFAKPGEFRPKPTDINGVLEATVELIQNQARKSNVEIERNYYQDLPKILLDSEQMRQVFMNLIFNGIQAIENEGRIQVETSLAGSGEADGFVTIKISDDGTGIAEEMQSSLFDPFFTTRDEGSGLGLAIVKQILNNHRGAITVDSRPGHGTTFTMSMPVHPSEERCQD
ncbi:ATP-binding protein [Thermodesulfobacteriota bacterium]